MAESLRAPFTLCATVLAVSVAGWCDPPVYHVAYASFGPLNTAVYIADADGGNARPLVDGADLDCNATFSPDGSWVLFTSRRGGSADIYRVRPDGTGLERLTDHPAFDDQAAMSPDGVHIAFVSSRSGQADIWVLDLRTRQLRNLTNHPAGDYRPAWSPDGRWIAFTSDRDSKKQLRPGSTFSLAQSTEIYVMRSDGTDVKRLTYGGAFAGGGTWSPDGRRIALYETTIQDSTVMTIVRRSLPATSQIVSIEIESGRREVLSSGPGRKFTPRWIEPGRIAYVKADGENEGIQFTDGSPGLRGTFAAVSWSPDRRRIVFHRELDDQWPPVTPKFSLDPQFALTRTGIFPSYSPDGRRMVVNSARAAALHNSLILMSADGTGRSTLFNDDKESAVAPIWSPRGDRIAFGLGGYFRGNALEAKVAVIGPDGKGFRTVTPSGHGNFGFPSWSPDGKRVVLRFAEAGSKGLAIVDADSGMMTSLTSGSWDDNFPAWSPKGDFIVFASNRDGDWELYTIRSDGSNLKRVTRSPGNDAHPAWSPDGRWIAFSSARRGFKDESVLWAGNAQPYGDIFVMRADGTDVRQLTDDAFEDATPAFEPYKRATSPPVRHYRQSR